MFVESAMMRPWYADATDPLGLGAFHALFAFHFLHVCRMLNLESGYGEDHSFHHSSFRIFAHANVHAVMRAAFWPEGWPRCRASRQQEKFAEYYFGYKRECFPNTNNFGVSQYDMATFRHHISQLKSATLASEKPASDDTAATVVVTHGSVELVRKLNNVAILSAVALAVRCMPKRIPKPQQSDLHDLRERYIAWWAVVGDEVAMKFGFDEGPDPFEPVEDVDVVGDVPLHGDACESPLADKPAVASDATAAEEALGAVTCDELGSSGGAQGSNGLPKAFPILAPIVDAEEDDDILLKQGFTEQ